MEKQGIVLVIDDDISFLKLTEEVLGGLYDVSVAKSAPHAFALINTGFVPDIILLDVDMPYMNGYKAAEELQAIEALQGVPIIFLTGATQTEAEIRGLHAGAVDYITKPFVAEILLARLQVHIEAGRQRRELYARDKKKDIEIDEEKFSQLADKLSRTECKIAALMAKGYTNQEICDMLNYSYSYVKKIVSTIFLKVGINKRHELRQYLK